MGTLLIMQPGGGRRPWLSVRPDTWTPYLPGRAAAIHSSLVFGVVVRALRAAAGETNGSLPLSPKE